MSGGAYRGGPMSPGPRPNMPRQPPGATYGGQGLPPGVDPSRTITPSRPQSSMSGTMWQGAIRSVHTPTVTTTIVPSKLWSGNIGRLWFSEIASTTGDVILGAGIVIWFTQITKSFQAVSLLLLALAVPIMLVSALAGSLASRRDTRRLITLLGMLRIALALLFVLMHFHTVVPIALLLGFGLALTTSMRGMLRRGAIAHGVPVRSRGLLASGDQVAAGGIAVAGPALATLLFILDGERIFTISLGAALCYALAFIGETRVEPLPDKILFQRPANATKDEAPESVWEEEDEDEVVVAAEKRAAVWELEAVPNTRESLADVNAGLRIAGTSSHALVALLLLALLALAGGALAAIEPFYVAVDLHQVPYVLGLLFTATGLGAALASAIVVELRAFGRFFLLIGAIASGIGLIMLTHTPDVQQALEAVALLGAANIFAIRGGQMTLLRHFVPVEQRAVTAALNTVRSVMSVVGIAGTLLILGGFAFARAGFLFATVGLNSLLGIAGLTVLIGSFIAAMPVLLPNAMMKRMATDDLDELPTDDDMDKGDLDSAEYSRYMPTSGRYEDSEEYSRYMPSRGPYANEESDEYQAPPRPSRRPPYDDEEDDLPPRSGQGRRPPARW